MGKYGMITDDDAGALESCLLVTSASAKENNVPFKILEIGVCHGDTSRGIKNFLDSKGIPFTYYGVDNQRDKPIEVPFDGANIYLGESSEVAYRLPDDFNFILIDGCHCLEHVIIDFTIYSNKLSKNGMIAFHDTGKRTQEKNDYQGHGDTNNRNYYIAVRKAITLLKIEERRDFEKVVEIDNLKYDFGGISVYMKIK
jgi:hypothetical protein